MAKIFLSYRRDDSEGIAGRIFERLETKFGKNQVFMDIESISPGTDFRDYLHQNINECGVFLAVIGKHWLSAHDNQDARRLDNPDDFVRIEIETALSRQIPVIPVLLGKTMIPKPDELPSSLQSLAYRQASIVDLGRDFDFHVTRLIYDIEKLVATAAGLECLTTVPEVETSTAQAASQNSILDGPLSLAIPSLLKAPFTVSKARLAQEDWAIYLGQLIKEKNSLQMTMMLIPPGEFDMGISESDIREAIAVDPLLKAHYSEDETPRHSVRLTNPYRLCESPVTQREYLIVMGRNPSHFSSTGHGRLAVEGPLKYLRYPVEQVSWFDAVEFCNRLSFREKLRPYYGLIDVERDENGIVNAHVSPLGGNGYRLPTEAEWEYACRAGTTTAYSFGNVCKGRKANIDGRFPYGTETRGPQLKRTSAVGSFRANRFGLRDMHGNIWEWCEDWYNREYYSKLAELAVNPVNVTPGTFRVVRGASWDDVAWSSRSASRGACLPTVRDMYTGFRIARTE